MKNIDKYKVVKFKANLEMPLTRKFNLRIYFDVNPEELKKEDSDGLGEKYIFCNVEIFNKNKKKSEQEAYLRDIYFPLNHSNISDWEDMFKNELWLLAKYWKKGIYEDIGITETNPETAWLFYKKTFDKVANGSELWENAKFSLELEEILPSGKNISLRVYENGKERIFCGEKYIGRIDFIKSERNEVVFSDAESGKLSAPFYLINAKEKKEFPEGKYYPLFGSKKFFEESCFHIYHKGSFQDMCEGLSMIDDNIFENTDENI